MKTFLTSQRRLTREEREHLLDRVRLLRWGARLVWLPTLLLGGAGILQADPAWAFPALLAVVPAGWAARRLSGRRRVIDADLASGKVRCVMGLLGGSDSGDGWVPLHLGTDAFWVRADLLADKERDQPITVELLGRTGIALTVDGRSNLPHWREGWRHDVPTL